MKRNLSDRRDKEGFTLIEMMIVIAIIGILATLVIRSFVFISTARDSKRISDIRTTQNYLELYYNAVGYYPPDANWDTMVQDVEKALPNIQMPVPANPSSYPYCYSPLSGAGNTNLSQPLSYVVGAQLENSNAANTDTTDKCAAAQGTLQCGNNVGGSGKYVYCTTPNS
ncbi:MAG: type II secretion system GspH family protein [Patescibacteria group bacterium]|nr:type II secretion system GspH family protein [Patescibacteria group bacterium]